MAAPVDSNRDRFGVRRRGRDRLRTNGGPTHRSPSPSSVRPVAHRTDTDVDLLGITRISGGTGHPCRALSPAIADTASVAVRCASFPPRTPSASMSASKSRRPVVTARSSVCPDPSIWLVRRGQFGRRRLVPEPPVCVDDDAMRRAARCFGILQRRLSCWPKTLRGSRHCVGITDGLR